MCGRHWLALFHAPQAGPARIERFHYVKSPAYTACPAGAGGIDGDDLAEDEPVEEHADGGEVLLYRRLRVALAELLDVSGDHHRLDAAEIVNPSAIAPAEKVTDGAAVGATGVRVSDVRREELEEAARGVLAGAGDDRRDGREAGLGEGSFLGDLGCHFHE
jgi:hypothetical protein